MDCPVCRFWAREINLTAPHHPTCPLRGGDPLSARLREIAAGLEVPGEASTLMRAAADELDRLKAEADTREVVGKVDFIPPYRERRRVDFRSMRFVYLEQLDPEISKRAKELSELMDRKVRELIERIPPETFKFPEQTREQIKKDLQAAQAAGWTVTPSHDELKLNVGAAADADEPIIRDG
jgi:hypothetical protein